MSSPTQGGSPRVFVPLLFVGLGIVAMVVLVIALRPRPAAESDEIIALTSKNWQREVTDSKVPVLVDFWAPWCGPCRELSPTIDKIAKRYSGKVKVAKVNIDKAKDLAQRFGVRAIPTVLIFAGAEQPQWSDEGIIPEAVLAGALDSVLKEKT